ncbi:MAG: chlorite dismutase family protein [Elusimicrobiota bacterium]
MNAPTTAPQAPAVLDIREKGAPLNGQPQVLDTRLFMQLLAFSDCSDATALITLLKNEKVPCVLYQDLSDPCGVGLLTYSEDPDFFTSRLRKVLAKPPFKDLIFKPEFTMLGRTYSSGYEADLKDWLLARSPRLASDPQNRWAIWYPLRRSGAFAKLSAQEQSAILREHGAIGRSFGEAGFAHDIRLACFGLDTNDNDFVIGLLGKDLHPLSATVQAMRKTQQTSSYVDNLGPFFIGRAIFQNPA